MPRYVDHEQRRRDIIHAANRVVAEDGVGGLTARAVAERLGGSTTMVTHYFSSQDELLAGLATSLVDSWRAELEQLTADVDEPVDRLFILLKWMVPLDDEGRIGEQARINLLAERIMGAETRFVFNAWEDEMRSLLRSYLTGIVADDELDIRVDTLRVLTNGLCLAATEHPDRWPAGHVLNVLLRCVADMGIEGTDHGR